MYDILFTNCLIYAPKRIASLLLLIEIVKRRSEKDVGVPFDLPDTQYLSSNLQV